MDEVEIFGEVKAVTDLAILLDDGDHEVWLPLSQIESETDDYEKGDEIIVFIPEWLAEEKELI
jgi:predicted RNA-binding protein (virulence factor B family)